MVVSDQMSAVDNKDQRRRAGASSGECHFLQLVEGTFNVQKGSSVPGPTDAEKAADVAKTLSVFLLVADNSESLLLMEFVVQGFTQSDAENLEIGMRFEHRTAIAIDLAHGL